MKFVCASLCLLSIAGGYWLGCHLSSKERALDVVVQSGESASRTEVIDGGGAADIESTLSSELEDLLGHANSWERLKQMVDFVTVLDADQLPVVAASLVADIETPQAEVLLRIVFTRWMEQDRAAAISVLFSEEVVHETQFSGVFNEQVQNWARSDFGAVWEYAEDASNSRELSRKLRYAVLFTLAEEDALRALELYQSLENEERVEGVLAHIVEQLAKSDVAHAKRLLDGASTYDRQVIVAGILRYYSEDDLVGGLEFARTLDAGLGEPSTIVFGLFRKRMNRAPVETMEVLSSMSDSAFRDQVFSMSLSLWANKDLEATLGWMMPRIAEPMVLYAWNSSIVHTIARVDPIRGLEMIAQYPELSESRMPLINAWMYTDPAATLDWAEVNLPSEELTGVLSRGVYAISAADPELAMRAVAIMPMGDQRDLAMVHVARSLAKQDVQGAMDWVLSHAEDAAQRNALNEVLGTWAETDPVAAGNYALNFETENVLLQKQMVRRVVSAWAEQNPSAALTWVNGFEQKSMRDSSMHGLVSEWSKKDFESAQAYVLSIDSAEERAAYLKTVLVSALHKDVGEVMAAFESLPDVEKTDEMTESLVMSWARIDSIAASEWVNDMEPSYSRDLAASALVGQITRKAPKDALPWALSIEDEALRNRTLGAVASGASHLDLDVVRQSIDAMTYGEKKRDWYRSTYLGK